MKNTEQVISRAGISLVAGFLLIAMTMLFQRTIVIIKDALRDSSKLRPTADRCDESQNSNEPHFTGCSSIL